MPSGIKEAFYNRLTVFIDNIFAPELNNHEVGGVFPNSRSINVTGDYRAIYQENDEVIMFSEIGTHSELYG